MSRRITSLHSLGTLFAKPFLSLLSRSGRAESGTPPSPLCHSLRHLLPVSPHQCVSSTRTEHRAGVLSLCCPLEWPGSGFQASVSMASSSQLITGGTQGETGLRTSSIKVTGSCWEKMQSLGTLDLLYQNLHFNKTFVHGKQRKGVMYCSIPYNLCS